MWAVLGRVLGKASLGHGLDLVLAAILIAFFTAHKYMPKHYNENIVLYQKVATTTTAIESGATTRKLKTVAKYENVFNEN